MHFIDAHAHHQQELLPQAETVMKQAIDAGITQIALGGTHPEDWKAQVQLHHRFQKNIFLNFGLHPWWVENYSRSEMEAILDQLDRELPLVSGLGETGLDFYFEKRDASRFEDQRFVFRAQLELAIKHQKPVVLHVVHAHEEVIRTLKEMNVNVPLVLHRYSGSAEQMREYLKLGAWISFHETKSFIKELPLKNLLLETDSNAKAHPGGWDVRPHYEKTAKIIGLPVQDLAQKVAENFARIGYSHGQ